MSKKIYVGNLPHSLSESELQELFETYGEVISAVIITDKMTGRSKGFGFVEMSSSEAAQSAIDALHGSEVGGRPLTVNEARPQTERPRYPRAGGGGESRYHGNGGGHGGGYGRERR